MRASDRTRPNHSTVEMADHLALHQAIDDVIEDTRDLPARSPRATVEAIVRDLFDLRRS